MSAASIVRAAHGPGGLRALPSRLDGPGRPALVGLGFASAASSVGPRSRREDEDAFSDLVGPYLNELVRLARRRLGCDDLAWEAVQEALMTLWGRGEPPPNLRAWLIRAVLFRSLHLRRTVRRRREHEKRACLARPESTREHPSRPIIVDEVRREVASALEKLGDRHREVLTLHLVDGLSYDEIAARLAVPVGTVRSRLSRAREALTLHLDPNLRDTL